MSKQPFYILILAAGASSRMGQPKQLLLYKGKPLIRHILEMSLQTHPLVIVVTGAGHEKIGPVVSDLPVEIVVNNQWENGMSTSLQCGLQKALFLEPQLQGVLIVLGDQPLITASHLRRLITESKTDEKALVATDYGKVLGVPAFIGKKYFPDLMKLTGDRGARAIFRKHPAVLRNVSFPPAMIDLDTEKDWRDFINGPSTP